MVHDGQAEYAQGQQVTAPDAKGAPMKPETRKTTVCQECGGSGVDVPRVEDVRYGTSAIECGACSGTGRIPAGEEVERDDS